MSTTYSKNLEIYNAKQFRRSISDGSGSNVFLTFGRVSPWANEAQPEVANTTTSDFYEVWRNMIGGKRVLGNDIRHVIPRIDWTANTVYHAYDDRTDTNVLLASNNKFYVITDEWRIYKCLGNNSGSNSTSKPTSTTTTTHFQTTDGYVWKYMTTLTSEERLRFATSEFVPVRTLTMNDGTDQWTVQQDATEGAIHNIVIANTGSGYTSNNISISITGDGIEANAYALRNVITNTVSSIVIDNMGSGYSYANVTITSDTGSNCSLRAIISPPGGHGSDPIAELGGSRLMINTRLINDQDGKFIVNNDFRQIALLENPYHFGTSNAIANTAFNQLTTFTLSGTSSEYIEDEVVYQGASVEDSTFSAVVADWDSTNNIIKVSNVNGTPVNDLLVGNTSTAARFLDSVINPDCRRFTGKLLYINNIEPIERAFDQTESFQIILNF